MKTLELKGYKSLKALNVFHSLMLGLKMLPMYEHYRYEDFFAMVQDMPASDQEKLIRESALFVNLEQDEIEALVCFIPDPNGVAYGPANLKSMPVNEIYEMVVAVALEVAKIKINFVTPAEKKKLKNFSVDIRRSFAEHPDATLEENLNLAFYQAVLTNVQ